MRPQGELKSKPAGKTPGGWRQSRKNVSDLPSLPAPCEENKQVIVLTREPEKTFFQWITGGMSSEGCSCSSTRWALAR